MATAAIYFFQSPKAATHYGGYPYKVSWSLMRGIKNKLNPAFCVSMATVAKFVQPIPNFCGLSGSTRCGCCSHQVSSISVLRVTCYDHFCVFFLFFSILAVSMATAAILKNQHLKAQLHIAYDIPTRFHKVWSRHLREKWRTKLCGKWNNKNSNNN